MFEHFLEQRGTAGEGRTPRRTSSATAADQVSERSSMFTAGMARTWPSPCGAAAVGHWLSCSRPGLEIGPSKAGPARWAGDRLRKACSPSRTSTGHAIAEAMVSPRRRRTTRASLRRATLHDFPAAVHRWLWATVHRISRRCGHPAPSGLKITAPRASPGRGRRGGHDCGPRQGPALLVARATTLLFAPCWLADLTVNGRSANCCVTGAPQVGASPAATGPG